MKADWFFHNGPIYDGTNKRPFAYLATHGNQILATGRGSGKKYVGTRTNILDLQGKSVVPGFIDSHMHFLDYAWSLERVNLENCATDEDVEKRLRDRALRSPEGEWVLGRGWSKSQFDGFPHKRLLDDIFPENPVALNSRDGHFLWVNTRALEAAEMSDQTSVSGGFVGVEDGSLTGILGENAVALMTSSIPKPNHQSRRKSLLNAQKRLHELGIVGLHSMDGTAALTDLQAIDAEGRLRLRIFHSIPHAHLQHAVALGMKTGWGDAWLRLGCVKIFSDGTLGSQSASMLEPFEGTNDRGIDTISPEELTRSIGLALGNGISVAVHAIGDRANRQTLDAFAAHADKLQTPRARSRIEHAQLLHPDDISRFARIGVVASMQPIHAISDCSLAEQFWADRARYSYAWRSLLEAGALLAFGSDAPIEDPDPLPGLAAAVHRWNWKDQSQTISATAALRAYCAAPAEVSGEAKSRGTLRPGKLADLVILSDNPMKTGFRDIKVTGTMIHGVFVYHELES